jgi:hypothetical protein
VYGQPAGKVDKEVAAHCAHIGPAINGLVKYIWQAYMKCFEAPGRCRLVKLGMSREKYSTENCHSIIIHIIYLSVRH